jgi:hypothetical protein
MTETRESRLDAVRRQMQAARYVAAMLALAAFGGAVAAARASHPAVQSQPDDDTGFTQSDDWSVDGFDWGTGSIGPSTGDSPSFGTRSS